MMGMLERLRELALTGAQCIYCGREVPEGTPACPACEAEARELENHGAVGDGILFAYQYGGVIRRLIHSYKYGDMPRLAPVMARSMADYLRGGGTELRADCITYVPIHKNRLRQRGFDQSELLALHLSILLGVPGAGLIARTRDTKPQYELSALERRENVEGAFCFAGGYETSGKKIILVDDIYTTGATIGECAAQLAGAEVTVFAFAREGAPGGVRG